MAPPKTDAIAVPRKILEEIAGPAFSSHPSECGPETIDQALENIADALIIPYDSLTLDKNHGPAMLRDTLLKIARAVRETPIDDENILLSRKIMGDLQVQLDHMAYAIRDIRENMSALEDHFSPEDWTGQNACTKAYMTLLRTHDMLLAVWKKSTRLRPYFPFEQSGIVSAEQVLGIKS